MVYISMESFVKTFVDAGVEVTLVEAFKSSISFLEAFVDAFVEVSVDVDFVKASITSAKPYITSKTLSWELSWKSLIWKLLWKLL